MPTTRRLRKAAPARSPGATAKATYQVRAKVWLYPGAGGWHFASLSARQSAEVRQRFGSEARGFGSLPVSIQLGRTTWRTSLFPDTKRACYLFAVKSAVRTAEHVEAGDKISAIVRIL